MSFLFVDQITAITREKATGIKQVTAHEPYLQTIYGEEIFIPSLIGEAIGQLAAWVAMEACDFECRPVAGVVSAVDILGQVTAGDTLQLCVDIVSLDKQKVQYQGEACVDGRQVFRIENAIGPMVPMEDYIDKAVARSQFAAIHAGKAKAPYEVPPYQLTPSAVEFDSHSPIIDGEVVWAQKTVTGEEPYLSDHFPKKPVLPLTILLYATMRLALKVIDTLSDFRYQTVRVQKIKMSRFVEPGDTIESELSVKALNKDQAVFALKTYKNKKRICVNELIFS